MGTGKNPEISHEASPQQEQVFEMIAPTMGEMFGQEYTPGSGGGGKGGGKGGGEAGSFSPTGEPWQPPAGLSPTANWWEGVQGSGILPGLQQPYMDAQRQGMELLGGSGGSARGGATGAAGAMTGDIMGQMARNVPQQAWNMGAEQRQATMLPYSAAISMLGGTYPDTVVQPGSDPFGQALGLGMGAGMLGWQPFA